MRGAGVWSGVAVPVVAPVGWARGEIDGGLRELERIRRTVDAASAALIAGLGTHGRDTAAAIVRATGLSGRRAREQAKAALVVESVAGAAEALARGEVSTEHLCVLARVGNAGDAAELLALAVGQSPEDFSVTVSRFEFVRDGAGVRERQLAARSVRFFVAEEGCVGVRGVFSPLEGAELKARLTQIADGVWRREHSERAEVLGGHGGPPLHARLADALMLLVTGEGGVGAGIGVAGGVAGRVAGGVAGVGVAGVAGVGLGSKPSIVITVNAETLAADVAGTGPGSGPVSLDDVARLAARADVYGAVQGAAGVVLSFGRSRRLASSLQRLAVIVRDGGRCAFDGCDASHDRCHVHHVIEFEHGGSTNLPNLALLCSAHHTHLHTNGLRLFRKGGRWVVDHSDEHTDDHSADVEWADTG